MSFDPFIAQRRFGTGVSARKPLPADATALLGELADGEDAWPVLRFAALLPNFRAQQDARRDLRQNPGNTELEQRERALRREARSLMAPNLPHRMARAIGAPFGFRERLVAFWADHFTTRGKNGFLRHAVANYIEEAIRPNIAGHFSTLLRAAVLHPMMLHYLDQLRSFGPNSRVVQRRGRGGLNENLARELLELHTLGIEGHYSQRDVQQLAELLAGLSFDFSNGFRFRENISEPGAETILGQNWGGARGDLATIEAFLDHLATQKDTARHLAHKLAVHFVSDRPNPALVATLAEAYNTTGGDLFSVYEALLNHPAAMDPLAHKVRQPFDFMTGSLRAIGTDPGRIASISVQEQRDFLRTPLVLMGQPVEGPPGPDGWPETAAAWLSPQALAARLDWVMTIPQAAVEVLPDPVVLARVISGADPEGRLGFVAENAPSRREAVGLILGSPAMMYR